MNQSDLERLLHSMADDDRTPAPPLDAMWSRIEARAFGPRPLSVTRRRWAVPVALAATLLLGVALGYGGARFAVPGPVVRAALDTPPAETPAPDPFVGVAGDYLEQTTALLVAVADDDRPSPVTPAIRDRARDLLSTTRLLLDSGLRDPPLRDLLEDLELVLAQIARMPQSPPAADSRFVSEALAQRDLLPRLTLLLADTRGTAR